MVMFYVCKFALGCGQVKFLLGILLHVNLVFLVVGGILNLHIQQLSVSDTRYFFWVSLMGVFP